MVNAFLGSNSKKSQEKKQWVAVGASANLISVLFALKGDFFFFFLDREYLYSWDPKSSLKT